MQAGLASNRDFLAGLLFMALGGGAFLVALAYPFGTIDEMGPGFFPRVLGLILVGFGLVTMARGLRSGERVAGPWGWNSLLLVTASLVAFGWLMEHFGLVPALAVLVVVSARAGREFRWTEVAVLTGILCLLAVAIFIWGLDLPYSLFSFESGR